MPATTIAKEQRAGLYELVRNHTAGLGDVWVAMEQGSDFVTAVRMTVAKKKGCAFALASWTNSSSATCANTSAAALAHRGKPNV